MTTRCTRCHCVHLGTHCPDCAARARPEIEDVTTEPVLPLALPEAPLSESETRERAEHKAAAIGVRCALRLRGEDADRRAILDGMRVAMREDGGSRYHHPAACRAVDAVEADRG